MEQQQIQNQEEIQFMDKLKKIGMIVLQGFIGGVAAGLGGVVVNKTLSAFSGSETATVVPLRKIG